MLCVSRAAIAVDMLPGRELSFKGVGGGGGGGAYIPLFVASQMSVCKAA